VTRAAPAFNPVCDNLAAVNPVANQRPARNTPPPPPQVWRDYHEGLEHLLHMAHHVLGSKPPRLLKRGLTSKARRLGATAMDRKALRQGSGKSSKSMTPSLTPSLGGRSGDSDDEADDDELGVALGRAPIALTPAQKAERSYHRMVVAMREGAAAMLPSKGELVLGFCGSVRCGAAGGRGGAVWVRGFLLGW
jgi:hypothetical protein